jgi:citrate lyase subunit beta/citryl-CoA lyase
MEVNMNDYLMRSLLFVPAHNIRLLQSATGTDADVLILDIEDSVQPIENKQLARDTIKDWVVNNRFGKHKIFVRVNDRESGQLLKDIYQLTLNGVEGFMYPKSKHGSDIYFIDKLLETIEYEKKLPVGLFKLIPLIETSSAVLNAQDICRASKRVIAIAFGCEDFITDLEGIHDANHKSLSTPRAMIAMAARANNVIPIDTVHINVHDLDDLEVNIKIAKNLGFEGMMLLHPKELPLVHKYFSPSVDEIIDAHEMIDQYETAQKEGKGVVIRGGKFVGPPLVAAARKTLKKNSLILEKSNRNLNF